MSSSVTSSNLHYCTFWCRILYRLSVCLFSFSILCLHCDGLTSALYCCHKCTHNDTDCSWAEDTTTTIVYRSGSSPKDCCFWSSVVLLSCRRLQIELECSPLTWKNELTAWLTHFEGHLVKTSPISDFSTSNKQTKRPVFIGQMKFIEVMVKRHNSCTLHLNFSSMSAFINTYTTSAQYEMSDFLSTCALCETIQFLL